VIDHLFLADLTQSSARQGQPEPPHDWIFFARNWVAERERKQLPATWNRLAVAIHRACGLEYAVAIPVARACLRHLDDDPARAGGSA
jgi:hypothetical protein